MKVIKFSTLITLALVLTVAFTGCRKRPEGVTTLPGYGKTGVAETPPGPPINPEIKSDEMNPTPLADPELRKNWPRDREMFRLDTVHFDFDSSVVRNSEKSKVAAVADYLKANTKDAVEIEGHCDERGTEEYNRSLGERRALALREELVRLGIDPMKIDTTSYGKDRPADTGHTESAWKQNRRGEFLLETPPK
jgi:peptidoglycan-associated lipoprotein